MVDRRRVNPDAFHSEYKPPSCLSFGNVSEPEMKVRLKIKDARMVLLEQSYDISDAESFGNACAHAWTQRREQRLERATSIGAVFEHLNDPTS
jgi:hypothetical protein